MHEMSLAEGVLQIMEDAHRFVQMDTAFGGRRQVDEQSPRIC